MPEEIKMVDVIDELSYRLAKNNEDYPNILFYLGIDSEELKNLIEDLSQEDAIDEIKDFLSNAKYKTKLESLATILNNEDFDFFIDKTHSRMRIIERFVFDDDKNVAKNVYQLEKKFSSEIKKIKSAIEKVERISFTNYSSTHDDGSNEVVKSGPRVILKDYTFGINDAGQILTIW